MLFQPPRELRRSVVRLLEGEAAKATARKKYLIPPFAPLAATISLTFVAGLAWLTTATLVREAAQGPLVAEITSSHIRSLLADHLLDVSSSDQHTVKPWFAGKTEYSPPVKDLAAQGFRLAGGRLDYLNGRHVAVLVYEHNKQVINLFICPASSKLPSGESTLTQDGYHLVRWTADGMTFWAVSDAATEVLSNFRDTIRE
jgi:anti-sigma factor RsiW